MPELPEVETMRIQLEKFLVGSSIKEVEVLNPRILSGDTQKVVGAKVTKVRRFAKVTSMDLSNNYSILTHVKLTGQYVYRGPNLKDPGTLPKKVAGGVPGPHTHVVFHLSTPGGSTSSRKNGGKLYYNDIRRFGWVRIEKTEDVEKEKFISKLGPEPFKDLTLELFTQILAKSARPIKVVLMDQSKIGGVGNIYANDALWLAQVNPKTPAKEIDNQIAKKLFDAILQVLEAGLKYGGASELAFVTPDGAEGDYQNHTLVFNHTGKLCSRCKKSTIEKYFLAGRGTYWCKMCQK